MAKENGSTKKAATKAVATKKKSGKGKWILIIIIILLVPAGAGYYLGWDKTALSFIKSSNLLVDAKNRWELFWDEKTKKGEPIPQVIELEKDFLAREPVPPPKIKIPVKKYYVKVEDCVDLTCQQEVIRFLKQERLPYTQRQSSRRTRYYELISTSAYTRQAAKAKIDLLKKEPEIKGEPYLVKVNNRYRVSLGQFPREDTGARVNAGLVYLYPKLKIEFELRPRNNFYKVKSIYAGPFKKSVAESVLRKLKDIPEYETSEITLKL